EQQFTRSLELVEKSSLSQDVKEDTRLADQSTRGRVARARGDFAAAGTAAEAYAKGAEARHNLFRVRQAHELTGRIALAQNQYDQAIAHLGQANQQDPAVLYSTALAFKAKGDASKAKEVEAEGANAHILQLVYSAVTR